MQLFAGLVPSPDKSSIDWQTVDEAFDWFRRMEGCPQDPIHHAEGDVKVHTRMVCEALVADPAWRALDRESRSSSFWAALLHDVAKPDCTRTDPSGRVVAPGHSRRGQIMARRILWEMDVPWRQREDICHIITHHQVPFYLAEGDQWGRTVHAISLQTRCDLLSILAEVDARGRRCPDLSRLLDNIEFFRELCREEQCYDQPKCFASAHSRFLYFRKDSRSPDYEAYDDWHGHVTLLSGLPGSGKDTWIASNGQDVATVSLDRLRNELDIAPEKSQGAVLAAARERAREGLRASRPLIWNATNLSRSVRAALIDLFVAYRAKVRIVYLEASERECMRRNTARPNPVPLQAFSRMLRRWEPPDLTECHELTICLTNSGEAGKPSGPRASA